jgi:hypothetical protein
MLAGGRANLSIMAAINWRRRPKEKKVPWGSSQLIEKAGFGEDNPRISFDWFWPSLAGFGWGLAEFGFGVEKPNRPGRPRPRMRAATRAPPEIGAAASTVGSSRQRDRACAGSAQWSGLHPLEDLKKEQVESLEGRRRTVIQLTARPARF